MTILDRPTLVDRPELVNRGNQEDEEDEQAVDDMEAEALGEGGGPIIHSIEFEPGDYELVAGSNLAAVLSTGQDSGDAFAQSFRNAAIQLYELQEAGEDISDLVRFSVEKGVAETGLSQSELEVLTRQPEPEEELDMAEEPDEEEDDEPVEDNQQRTPEEEAEEEDDQEDGDELEEVEESIEEVKEDDSEDEG